MAAAGKLSGAVHINYDFVGADNGMSKYHKNELSRRKFIGAASAIAAGLYSGYGCS